MIILKLFFLRIADGNGTAQGETAEPWRIYILKELKERLKNIDWDYTQYEKAIEK